MASKLNNTDSEIVDTEEQKEFLDPATTAIVGSVAWFSFKAIAQSVIGWAGLTIFTKWWEKWKNRGKNDGDSTEVSTEESKPSS